MLALVVGAVSGVATVLALAWKWQLGVRRAGTVAVALAGLAGGVVSAAAAWVDPWPEAATAPAVWLLTLGLAGALVGYRFYRDPERVAPNRDDVILSPADGEVVYVRAARGGVLPVSTKLGRDYALEELTKTSLVSTDNVVIGIALNFLDVHVNRAPIEGRAAMLRHVPGAFRSLRRPEAVFENERATLVIENDDLQVAVVMIASRLVRRIVTYVTEGAQVAAGDRIGVIRFGSQVDLVLPLREDLSVAVSVGDRVVAGETIISEWARRRVAAADLESASTR